MHPSDYPTWKNFSSTFFFLAMMLNFMFLCTYILCTLIYIVSIRQITFSESRAALRKMTKPTIDNFYRISHQKISNLMTTHRYFEHNCYMVSLWDELYLLICEKTLFLLQKKRNFFYIFAYDFFKGKLPFYCVWHFK